MFIVSRYKSDNILLQKRFFPQEMKVFYFKDIHLDYLVFYISEMIVKKCKNAQSLCHHVCMTLHLQPFYKHNQLYIHTFEYIYVIA